MNKNTNGAETDKKSSFRHKVAGRVKYTEIDMIGIVHNIRYFYWAENARADYFKEIGEKAGIDNLLPRFNAMAKHLEADYFNPVGLDQDYEILTRTSSIGADSIFIEQEIKLSDGKILFRLVSEIGFADRKKNILLEVPEEIKQTIAAFEGREFK